MIMVKSFILCFAFLLFAFSSKANPFLGKTFAGWWCKIFGSCRADPMMNSIWGIGAVVDYTTCMGLPSEIEHGCRKILAEGQVPKEAFLWTMNVYRKNLGRLTTGGCMGEFSNGRCSSENTTVRRQDYNKIFKGIQNQCHLIVNDVRREKTRGFLAPHYFIDLCKGTVAESQVRVGLGTFSNNYANKEGMKTTVLGAFMVVPKIFRYKGTDERGATLIGMQKTNNQSGMNCKYLHETELDFSWGCPSIDKTFSRANGVISKMTQSPALLVNYGPEELMEDIDECRGSNNRTSKKGKK